MIVVRFEGGLGNIMFEYACGRRMAHVNNTALLFDVDACKTNPLGDYSFNLEAFNINIQPNLASPEDLERYRSYRSIPSKKAFFHNLLRADKKKYIEEKYYHFDPGILALRGDMYLHGWWQTEKYFSDIREILLNDFSLRNPFTGTNSETAEKIKNSESVSIHIRRLDYVKNPKTRQYHGELPKNYYDATLELVAAQARNPRLFIFSDDVPWVKEHMRFPFETHYIEGNRNLPHEDITLMSLSKHNIIANSSFSWWGAWLNRNPGKIVVAPTPWVAETSKQDSKDVVPGSWIKLPAHYICS